MRPRDESGREGPPHEDPGACTDQCAEARFGGRPEDFARSDLTTARRKFMEDRSSDGQRHSALMLAARITLPHFSVSSSISFRKSAGEPARIMPPRSVSWALSFGSARPALISVLSLSTISPDVFPGAPTPK